MAVDLRTYVGGMQDVALRGHYAYVTDGAYFQPNSLKIIDVSNPLVPSLIAKALTSAVIIGRVSLYGDYAFVTDQMPGQGLWAININPGSASYKTSYGPCDTVVGAGTGSSLGVAAFGPYAYVADDTGWFAIVDTSSPATFSDSSLKSNLAVAGAQDVTISGKYAYVTCTAGLAIVKLF